MRVSEKKTQWNNKISQRKRFNTYTWRIHLLLNQFPMKKRGMRLEGFYTDSQRHLDLHQRKIHLSIKYSSPQNVWIREYKHILSGLFLLVHLTKKKCVYYLSKFWQSLRLSIALDSIKRKVWSLDLLHCRGYIVHSLKTLIFFLLFLVLH